MMNIAEEFLEGFNTISSNEDGNKDWDIYYNWKNDVEEVACNIFEECNQSFDSAKYLIFEDDSILYLMNPNQSVFGADCRVVKENELPRDIKKELHLA